MGSGKETDARRLKLTLEDHVSSLVTYWQNKIIHSSLSSCFPTK